MGKDEKHRSSKDSRSKHKKHKKSHKKNHKKEKDRKKRRDHSSSADTSSTSTGGDAPPHVDVNTQLAMGRAAARALREILAYNYDLRTEIRQLSRHLDTGNALDISGLEDVFLRDRLCILFDNLLQLKKTVAGHYFYISKAATVTSFVAPILEESLSSLARYKVLQTATETVAAVAAAPLAPTEEEENNDTDNRQKKVQAGPALPPDVFTAAEEGEQLATREEESKNIKTDGNDNEETPANPIEQPPLPGPRRVLGPAMPPPELLQAAAATAAAIPLGNDDTILNTRGAGAGGVFSGNTIDVDDDFIVGPPPPEYLLETDAVSMDDRSLEVARVMEVLRRHESDQASGGSGKLTASGAAGAAPEPVPADAYLLLGVDPSAPVGDIKKRYWRLSLLIHPDKCDHPNAAVAFQAVATAARTLQDAAGREGVDKRREEAELRRFTETYAAQEEKERQWRIARGQATAEDLAKSNQIARGGAAGGGGGGRDAWMTELPPEKSKVSALPPQGHQTAFSSRGPQVRGDTSGWTMTPQQRAAAAEAGAAGGGLGGPATGPALLMAGISDGGGREEQRAAAAVAAYNSVARGKSLLEQHMEKQQQQKKKKQKAKDIKDGGSDAAGKKRKKSSSAKDGEEEEWDREAHPWRPFDREKDLEIKPSGSRDPKELLKNMKGLSSRFAGSGGGSGGGR